MAVSITKPTVGAISGWGATLNTALDILAAAVNGLLPDGGQHIFTRTTDPSSEAHDGDVWLAPLS